MNEDANHDPEAVDAAAAPGGHRAVLAIRPTCEGCAFRNDFLACRRVSVSCFYEDRKDRSDVIFERTP